MKRQIFCQKRAFPSFDAAYGSARRLMACGMAEHLRVYECPFCGGFHLTHKPERLARQAVEKLRKQ